MISVQTHLKDIQSEISNTLEIKVSFTVQDQTLSKELVFDLFDLEICLEQT